MTQWSVFGYSLGLIDYYCSSIAADENHPSHPSQRISLSAAFEYQDLLIRFITQCARKFRSG